MGKTGSKGGKISSSFPEGKPKFVYWNICGRGDMAVALLYAGNIEYDLDEENANSWPAYKDQTPFGQLPVLIHGDITLAQGGAINRYVARLGGLYPEDPVAASKCDMIIEECMDIYNALFKPKNGAKDEKEAAWKKIKDEVLPTHFGLLEKMLEKGGKPYFGGEKPDAADVTFYAVYGIFEKAKCGAEEELAKHPKLAAVIEGTKEVGNLKSFDTSKMGFYFSSDPENDAY